MGVVFVAEIIGANLFARMFETTAIDKGGMGGDCSGVGNTGTPACSIWDG